MTRQPSLPGRWPRSRTWPRPSDRLFQLAEDKREAGQEIRQVLGRHGDQYGIRAGEVPEGVWGYIDDLLADYFADKEAPLREEIAEKLPRPDGPVGCKGR